MKRPFSIVLVLMYLCSFLVGPVWAEAGMDGEFAAMKNQFEQMQKRMDKLEERLAVESAAKQNYERRVNELETQLAGYDVPKVNDYQSKTAKSLPAWIPEVGVVADTLFTLNSAKTDNDGEDRLNVRELELVLGSEVDPYSRLDATIGFSTSEDEPVHLEEAYLTRFELSLDSTARLGKFKPKVGKALLMHRDSLDTVDEPLVIQRYFSEEGFSKSGVDLTTPIDLNLPVTQELSLGVLEGGNHEEEGIFGETKRRPTLYSHLKNYFELGEATGLELGGSYMIGSRDEDSHMEVQVLAADATFKHDFNANQNIKFQSELFHVDRKESLAEVDDGLGGTIIADLDGDFWGAYGLADLRLHPRWSVGGRYDIVEPIAVEVPVDGVRKYDQAYTGYLTFYQSEFARWRAQFTHTDVATGKDDNAVYLQGTFSIGTHKHKLQ